MCAVEITTHRNEDGSSLVIVRDPDLCEIVRLEALSADHARNMAADCAMLVTKMQDTPVILRDHMAPANEGVVQ